VDGAGRSGGEPVLRAGSGLIVVVDRGGTSRVWVIMESTLISQMIRPDASARLCSPVTIAAQTPARCHRRNSEHTARQDP
jgi:hypothetical protein